MCGTALYARPNILFIMSDDHVHTAIGAYGSRLAPLNPTPNLDKLASEGMILRNVFCQNSICSPSRATIMTGQSSATNGVRVLADASRIGLPASKQYLAIEMKNAGYTTAVIGKWHLYDLPSSTAFDYYLTLDGQGTYWNPSFYEKGRSSIVQFSGHSTPVITDRALNWLDPNSPNGRDPDKPFFLMLHYKAPHDMFNYDSTNPVVNSYLDGVTIPEPTSLYDFGNNGGIGSKGYENELHTLLGSSVGVRCIRGNYYSEDDVSGGTTDDEKKAIAYQQYLLKYLRCVKGIDENVVRVFDYLKSEGIYDDTLIVYTADQGFWLGEHDFWDKRWAYEESLRMPFIVRYPTISAGSSSDAIIENVDFAPTLLDFAGVATPAYMQGRSFKSIMETGTEPPDWKQEAYYHYWYQLEHLFVPAHIAIRTKDYKLIMFYGTPRDASSPQTPVGWELYDMKNDPFEMNNLIDDPAYSNIIRYLKERLAALRTYYKEDDPAFPHNQVINEYWDYDIADYHRAVNTSLDYYHVFYSPVIGDSAPITWSYSVLTSGASEVSTEGTLLEALNFSSLPDGFTDDALDTTINTVKFEGFTDGNGDNGFLNPTATYFSANSSNCVPQGVDTYTVAKGGLAKYDALNSRFIWAENSASNRITLNGLTAGNGYRIQLFMGDTRGYDVSVTVDDGKGNTLVSPTFNSNGRVGFVINGEFTAVSDQQFLMINRGGEGMHLNGYQLREISTGGGGGPGGGDSVPDDIRGLARIAGDSQVFLNWIDGSETDIDYYNIYRGLTAGSLTVIDTTAAGDYTDTTVVNGTRYFYAVSVVDLAGQESGQSNQVLAIPHSPGDIDRNGRVDLGDMSYLSGQWLTNGLVIPSADIDTTDGFFEVDINDLALYVSSWLDRQ